jgi:hypothetical protein
MPECDGEDVALSESCQAANRQLAAFKVGSVMNRHSELTNELTVQRLANSSFTPLLAILLLCGLPEPTDEISSDTATDAAPK